MRRPLAAVVSTMFLALWCVVASSPWSASSAQPAAPRRAAADDARAVVREATRAAEGGAAAPLRTRLEARLRADPGDRAAALGLATIERLTYDYASAEPRYHRLIDGAGATDAYAIYARLGLAEGRDAQGRMQGQERLLDAARDGARSAGDGAAEGEALLWQSLAFGQVYGGRYAIAKTDSALRVLPADATDLQAASRCRRAQVVGLMGLPGAADSLDAASEFARRAGDAGARAACLRAVGVFQLVRGFVDSSLVTYDSLVALRRRMHDRSNLSLALVMSADALRGRGDMGRALPLLRESLEEARASHNLYAEATITLGLGGIALTLNDHATAAANVRRAVAAFEAADDSGSAMRARSFLPFVSIAAGDYPRARQEVQAVLPWAKQVGDWSHVVELYTQLAAIEMRTRDWAAADRALDSAAATARRLGPASEEELYFPRGRLALYRGDLDAAERNFTRYLGGLDSARRLERYETRTYLADVRARRGDLARAARELTVAGDELDAWRARLDDAEVRTLAFQAGATEANDRNASVARVLAALAAGGRADEAFALAERRRARELAERITRVHALHAGVAAGVDSSAAMTRPAARRPQGAATATSGASAAAIAAAIPDDSTALLEFVTGVLDAPTTLFVLARGTPVRAYVLPPADSLVDDVARFVALTESGKDPGALARSLGATLLGRATPALPAAVRRIVFVPDGPLHRVPWDALQLADGHYVTQRYATSVAPSATVLAELWQRTRTRGASERGSIRLLAYGDPAFADEHESSTAGADGGAADAYRSAFDSSGGLPRLPASADEARLVARYADDADVRLRDEASAASLKHGALDGYRVLHLATHALVDERSVARTALALAPGGGESGFVGAADLAALTLDADLVVLSACRSAGGVVVDGEGVQGLTAPLLEAGARSVVATGWRIGDRTTVAFVNDFYDAMARGLAVGDALAAAKRAAIGRGAPPREWAAFVAVGDPLVDVPLHAPRSDRSRLWLLAASAVLAVGAAATLTYRRRGRPAPEAR